MYSEGLLLVNHKFMFCDYVFGEIQFDIIVSIL